MIKYILVFSMLIGASLSFAQAPASSPTPAVAIGVPIAASLPVAVSAPAPVATVQVAAASAPPAWLQEFLTTISALPLVGPYVSKLLVWVQALGGILTALVAFLLAASAALKAAFNFTGLDSVVTWIESFQQSSVMYWLTSLSNLPVHLTPAQAAAPPQATPAAVKS